MTWNPFYRFPAIALSVLIIAALPFVGHIRDFKINSQVEILLAGDQRNFQSYQKIKEVISTSIPVFVSMKVENIYSPEGISAIHRVSEAFYDMPGFLDAKSLTHSYKPVRSGMSFDMIPLASTNAMDPESLSRLRDYCRENPLVRNIITAPDDQHNIIWLNFVGSFATNPSERTAQLKNFHQQILDRLKPFEKEGISFKIIGVPLVENEVYQTIMSDARSFIGLSLLVLLVLFGVTFRSLWATVLVGMNLVFTFILIPLVFVICRFELTVFNLVLLPLLGVIHLTLLTHLFLAFLAALKSGVEHPVGSAVSKIWKSSAFASLTTAVSFGSLALSDVKQVALFGILGAIGMLILFFISFGPGLSVLCLASRFRLF